MADVVAKGGTTLYVSPEYVTAFVDAKGNTMSATLDPKDPLENKNYFVDVSAWMAALGTQISEFTGNPILQPDDQGSLGWELVSGTLIRLVVGGGVAGTIFKVIVPFSTTDAQDLIATIHVPVRSK